MEGISIIIITYNRLHDTIDLMNDIIALNNTHLLKDVIILNNKSTDDYSAMNNLISNNPTVPFNLLEAPENLGVSRGRNYATKFAKGQIFFYIDDDINLKDKDTLKKIIDCFSTNNTPNRKLGVVSFKVIYSETMQMQVTAFPHKKFEQYKTKHRFQTSYYAGCAHAKLRDAWKDTGPYPKDFFYGMEEYDFSYRVLNAGYCIEYNDSFEVIHKESPLGRKSKEEKLRMMWLNKSKVAWRYLPKKYFYSTAFMWSLEYLKKTGFQLQNYFSVWRKIFSISSTEKRTPVKQSTLEYLKKVDARLWY